MGDLVPGIQLVEQTVMSMPETVYVYVYYVYVYLVAATKSRRRWTGKPGAQPPGEEPQRAVSRTSLLSLTTPKALSTPKALCTWRTGFPMIGTDAIPPQGCRARLPWGTLCRMFSPRFRN